MSSAEFATVARILRPQGRKGEVAVELFTDFPERFAPGLKVWLAEESQPAQETVLEDAWPHKGGWILKFAGVDSISDAEQLAGKHVQVLSAERVKLEGSAVYVSDLIGCSVVENGEELGKVANVDHRSGTPLLIVETPQGELMIPFADEICKVVDVTRGVVEVELPEGLRDLNG